MQTAYAWALCVESSLGFVHSGCESTSNTLVDAKKPRKAAVGNLFAALERQTGCLSRQDKQPERRFREHAQAEQAKDAPSQEMGAFFADTTQAN
jgi:hypothetical protein